MICQIVWKKDWLAPLQYCSQVEYLISCHWKLLTIHPVFYISKPPAYTQQAEWCWCRHRAQRIMPRLIMETILGFMFAKRKQFWLTSVANLDIIIILDLWSPYRFSQNTQNIIKKVFCQKIAQIRWERKIEKIQTIAFLYHLHVSSIPVWSYATF